jgi:hypothetical protein
MRDDRRNWCFKYSIEKHVSALSKSDKANKANLHVESYLEGGE